MTVILQQIDQQKQELEKLRPIKPEYLAKIREKFKLEYNFYSNNLEGNTLTLGETRSLILHSYKVTIDKKLKDIEEMKSHIEVYDEVGFLQDKILTKDQKPLELSQNLIYEKLLASENQILEGVHWEFKDKKNGNRIYKIVLYLLVKFDNSYWNISLDFRKYKWYGENLGQHEKTYKYGEFISEDDIKEFIAFLIKTSKEFLK